MSSKETRTMLKKIFRSKSLNLPKLKFGRRDKEKRVQSLEYTSLKNAEFKWQLYTGSTNEVCSDVVVKYPCDVIFLEANIFVVADSEGHKLDIFDLSREGNTHCGTIAKGKIWPNSVARYTNDNGKVLVTDRREKEIKIFDVERGRLISSWGSPWSDEDTPYRPHGITMTSKKEVIVTETSSHCVHVYNKHGKLQHTFGKLGNLLEQMCLPFYCSVDTQDRILISDNLNYSVKLYTSKGRQVAFLGAGQYENFGKKMDCPLGVCSDLDGNVLVCDNETNRIVQYDLVGAEYERESMTRSIGLLSGVRKSASELGITEYSKEVVNSSHGCFAPCGVAVGPCGTMVFTESTRGHASVKAYSLYSVESDLTSVTNV